MSTEFPEISQLIGNDITEGDFKVAISQFLDATRERFEAFEAIGDGRSLGECVMSFLPLRDAGLHLLDGSFLSYGGVYTGFIQHVLDVRAEYPLLFCTQEEFDASVSANGSCGKFVVSDAGVRLPKVSDILQGTTDLSAVGDLVEAGLPNITGTAYTWGWAAQNYGTDGAFSVTDLQDIYSPDITRGLEGHAGWKFDASRSSPYYRDGIQKPTPQTIKSLLYICVATSIKTPVEANIDNIITDNNNKADKDFANVTKPYIVEMGENSAGWWKILSNGWVEQGGIYSYPSNRAGTGTVRLPVEMRDGDYFVAYTPNSTVKIGGNHAMCIGTDTKTPVSFFFQSYGVGTVDASDSISWKVEGWKA